MIAMLLAAGRGERMRPLTDHTPKPLLQAGGKPLIVWHIEKLARAGICDLVINHAHLGSQIEAALGNGSSFGVRILYSPENPALETAGGIANALPLLCKPSPSAPSQALPLPEGEGREFPTPSGRAKRGAGGRGEGTPFAVINSDIYCDYDFTQLPQRAAALEERGDMAHLILVNNPPQHPNGDFCLDANRIKPTPLTPIVRGERAPQSCSSPDSAPPLTREGWEGLGRLGGVEVLTFSGIGIYQPSLFASIARGTIAHLAPLLRAQIAHNKVSGEHYTGRWVDVGTPHRLQQLDNLLRATHNDSHA